MAKPVIASEFPHTKEEVINGVTGVLVKPGDSEELAKEIVRILSDDKLAEQMGENGYRRAKEMFDITANVKQVLSL